VNVVQLPVTVTDTAGRNVGGLPEQAFELFVDGEPTSISAFHGDDAPVTAGIVIDNSASMAPKQSDVVDSALAFAQSSNPVDQMFVVHFNDHVRLGLPVGVPFTGDISLLKTAVSQFKLGGTTALFDALIFAESQFRKSFYQRKVLLVITDGTDNSSKATMAEVLDAAGRSGILISAIGLFDQEERSRGMQALSQLAQGTGGTAFFPAALADATRTSEEIAHEIRRQYTVDFQGAEDGQFHRIEVKVKDPRYGPLSVRTRPGYIALRP
jgi:VWFA-related protein